MLVLTRKVDERILLLVDGKQIELVVTGIRNHRAKAVRIGIEAPGDVLIIRPELLEHDRQMREGARQLFGEAK